jgi:hypothetical protein
MSPEDEVKPNVISKNPRSPISERSDLGIEQGAVSIKSDSSVGHDAFTEVRIDPEDPHLVSMNLLAKQKQELKDPIKKKVNS